MSAAARKSSARDERIPQSPDAEKGVLSCMMISPAATFPIVASMIGPDYFYTPANRTTFTAACHLYVEKGVCDLVTLTQRLDDLGQLPAVGGHAYVTSIYTFVGSAALVDYYLDIVREKYVLREAITKAKELLRSAQDDQDEGVAHLLQTMAQSHEYLVKIAAPVPTRLPGLRDLSQMLGENKPQRPPELVEGILHQGSKLIVGGTSKGRKTYSLLDLAISVATGTPWWGFPCVKGPVCYINFEIQEAFFCDRVETICKAKGTTLPPGALMGWNLRGHGEGIERLMTELLAVLHSMKFVLIIFDPIYKALGDRDENKAGDVASMLNELEKIAVTTQSAIAFGAHYSKGNQAAKESIDRIGGSGVFARDPDSILTMTPHETENAFTVDATLRNFKPLDPFVVTWEWPLFTRDDLADPRKLKQQKKNTGGQFQPIYDKGILFEILEDLASGNGWKPKEVIQHLDEQHNVKRTTVYELKSALQGEGKLIVRDGMWFRGQGNGS